MAHSSGMIVQTGGSRPHVAYIMKALANTFPNIIWKIGGKVDRTTWGGGFSAHSVGRACDIYLDAGDPVDKRLGDLLLETFATHGYNFKVDHVIWNGQIWSRSDGGPSGYTGSGGAHRDHVHVAFVDDQLDVLPLGFPWILEQYVLRRFVADGVAADRSDGLYGQAFDPKKPNVRLTRKKRHAIMLKKMGMTGAM
jgi:hypothetical protein